MKGVLIVFFLPLGSPKKQHRTFRRRIYGEETSSWGGRYRYRRKGLLDGIPHVLLYTGVVIVKEQNAGKLVRTIEGLGGTVFRRQVKLTGADARALGVPLS
jgi:hypothetical protein